MKTPYFLTAYGIAVKHGFKGTEEEWLNSLTAFYLAQQAGYTGTADEWLEILNDPVPRISIGEVVTLEGGSEATVEISGDARNPVLNFGIPRGMGMVDALALVGGTMKGVINMGGNRITNLGEPQDDNDAITRKYAEEVKKIADKAKETADAAMPKAGGDMRGDINMNGNRVADLAEPVLPGDAATMKFVNDVTSKMEYTYKTIVLVPGDWNNNQQTAAVSGMNDNVDLTVSPTPDRDNVDAYSEAGVLCIGAETDRLIFLCKDTPSAPLYVNIKYRDLGGS